MIQKTIDIEFNEDSYIYKFCNETIKVSLLKNCVNIESNIKGLVLFARLIILDLVNDTDELREIDFGALIPYYVNTTSDSIPFRVVKNDSIAEGNLNIQNFGNHNHIDINIINFADDYLANNYLYIIETESNDLELIGNKNGLIQLSKYLLMLAFDDNLFTLYLKNNDMNLCNKKIDLCLRKTIDLK